MPFVADPPPPPWRSPVTPIAIVRPYRAVAPFAAGGHRGVDLQGKPGAAVTAPCAGRITFRGAVAGGPPTITIDCGELRATLQRVVSSVAVGEVVDRGAPVGHATERVLDLSARRADGTYLDPARLLGASSPVGVPVAAPRAGRPGRSRPALTMNDAYRPARIADRALVTPHLGRGQLVRAHPPTPAVDRPLGLVASAVMALVGAAWVVSLVRRRLPILKAARGTGLARVQR